MRTDGRACTRVEDHHVPFRLGAPVHCLHSGLDPAQSAQIAGTQWFCSGEPPRGGKAQVHRQTQQRPEGPGVSQLAVRTRKAVLGSLFFSQGSCALKKAPTGALPGDHRGMGTAPAES